MIAIKDYKAIYEYRNRRQDRIDGKRLDDEWKTIKGTHVMVDDEGSIAKGPENLRNLSSKKQKNLTIGEEMRPINSDYAYEEGDDEQDFTHKNIKKLKPIYDEHGIEACHDEWYKFRLENSTKDIHEIAKDEADEVMYDNVRQSVYDGWFRNADSSYKPQLTYAVIKNPEMRNAALNMAYENYKNSVEKPLPFEEFLVTPIKMYRGENGQRHLEDDVFDAYTFDRKMAEHFASKPGKGESKVIEIEVRPIDTYGSMRAVGEAEIWVPRQLSPVGYRGDSVDEEITWERYNPIKWALEDYKEEDDGCVDLLDSIIQEAEMVKLFDGGDKESDRLTMDRCIESIQKTVLQLTAKFKVEHEDGVFFANELNGNLGERNIQYPEVDAYRERRNKRLDAREDEEGRWVTTEEKHKIHLNEEGVPDKGNPHVISAMTSGTKTRTEIITARVKKKAVRIKAFAKKMDDASEAHEAAIDEKMKADRELKKAERIFRRVNSSKKFIKDLGYGEGDLSKMRRESDDLQIKMDSLKDNRPVYKLSEEEKAKYTELESRKNQVDYAIAVYGDCYGPDAFTRESVARAREKASDAEKKMRQSEREYRQARAEFKRKAKSGDIDKAKLMTDEERSAAIEKISGESGWGAMSERQRTQALDVIKNASDAEIQLMEKTFGGVDVVDGHGMRSRGESGSTAWYMPGTGSITMSQEDMERPSTMWHEFGHYLDDPESSGLSAGNTKLMGTVYKNSLSQSVVDAKILHGDSAAGDIQKLLDETNPGRFRVESSGGNMLRIFDSEIGEYVDDKADASWDYHLSNLFSEKSMEYRFKDEEYDNFLRSIGYPTEDEAPKLKDYMEEYTTPKRGLKRQRERFKGAKEEYHKKIVEYNERVEKALSEHGDEYAEQTRARNSRVDERTRDVGDVSDILDGIFRGQGPWAVWGHHGKDYYAEMNAPAKEAVAHFHQMRVMGRTGGIEFLRSLLPSVADGLESVYNEWLWRNVDV